MQMPITTFTLRSAASPRSNLAIDATLFDLEAFATDGPGIKVQGFSEVRNKELEIRVRSALSTAGYGITGAKVDVRVGGMVGYSVSPMPGMCPALDLPIALGLMHGGRTPRSIAIAGELGLDGHTRPIRGVFAFVQAARAAGLAGVLVPTGNVTEAMHAADGEIEIYGLTSLSQLADADLLGAIAVLRIVTTDDFIGPRRPLDPDFRDVRGHAGEIAKIATAIAERQDIVLTGPPGTGKTLLARRIPSILKPLTESQSAHVTKIYSSLGLASGRITERPFRAPHHSISASALLGADGIDAGVSVGASLVGRPGEIHLAAHGVLLLDEVGEFSNAALLGLRHALERMGDARPIVVACADPDFGPARRAWLERALATLGIIGERIAVDHVPLADLRTAPPGEPSAEIRARIWGLA